MRAKLSSKHFFIPMSMIFTASVGSNHLQRPIQFLVIFSSSSSADGYIVYCREKKNPFIDSFRTLSVASLWSDARRDTERRGDRYINIKRRRRLVYPVVKKQQQNIIVFPPSFPWSQNNGGQPHRPGDYSNNRTLRAPSVTQKSRAVARRRYFYDDLATLIGFDSFLLLLPSGKQQL